MKDIVSRLRLSGRLNRPKVEGRKNSRMEGFTTILQIRTVTMLAARDNGVNTCNLRKMGSTTVKPKTGGGFVPDEGDVVFDKRVGRVDG